MREYTFSLSEVAERIERLPVLFDEEDVTVVHVTQNGKRVMEILPAGTLKALHAAIDELSETVDTLLETLEIVQDEELMEALRRGIKDMEEGRVTSLDDAMKELGWE
jgi:rubrerythrin